MEVRDGIKQCDFCGASHSEDLCMKRKQIEIKACPICLDPKHYWTCCPYRSSFCGRCKEEGHLKEECPHVETRNCGDVRSRPIDRASNKDVNFRFTQKSDADGPRGVPTVDVDSDRTITIKTDQDGLASLLASNLLTTLAPSLNSALSIASGPSVRRKQNPKLNGSAGGTLSQAKGHSTPGDMKQGHHFQRRNQNTNPTSAAAAAAASDLNESNYLQRLGIYDNALWPTLNEFICPLCDTLVKPFQGVVIKTCQIHKFCRTCLRENILSSPWREVSCPFYTKCDAFLDEDEVRALLSFEPLLYDEYRLKQSRHEVENDLTRLEPYLHDSRILHNLEKFDCPICLETIEPLEGVCAKTCKVHFFCRTCMIGAIRASDEPRPRCPAVNCEAYLLDVEIEALDPDQLHRLLDLGVERAIAHAGSEAFHCMVPDCKGMWFLDGDAEGRFDCPVCNQVNCLTCKIVHVNRQSCDAYRKELEDAKIRKDNVENEAQAKEFIDKLLKEGRCMRCPRCGALVEKISGCDALQCMKCNTELCWATKGLRWGPKGRGDYSGGCRCRFQGKRCHPACENCH